MTAFYPGDEVMFKGIKHVLNTISRSSIDEGVEANKYVFGLRPIDPSDVRTRYLYSFYKEPEQLTAVPVEQKDPVLEDLAISLRSEFWSKNLTKYWYNVEASEQEKWRNVARFVQTREAAAVAAFSDRVWEALAT